MDIDLFFFNNCSSSDGNSDNKYLRSASSRFAARLSNEAFKN